ncbi:MFS transporter [Propionispora hippei]|uniref:Major Facilitator Superfamily protein n=1 Tax=Propionispora hippei DSM 15287 TaxID=1123003 RepID=A0A1M6GZY7_9FIRM|nr:MFS transporter [Propionispora hippei]SHJ15480.1 Major Facilitator Superfamily protein [Propionispora hippei DSM 15287]
MNWKTYKFNLLIWIIIIGVLFLRIGTSMTVPFLAIFLHYKVGISLSITGMIVGTSYLSYTLGGFLGGYLSDKYGRKKTLGISLLCYGLIFGGFGIAASVDTSKAVVAGMFCTLNLFAGLFRIWSDTLTQAMLADVVTYEQKVIAFNLRYTVANIGSALGPILGAWIGFSGTVDSFYFTGVMCWAYLALLLLIASKSKNHWDKQATKADRISISMAAKTLFYDKSLRLYIVGGIISYLAYVQQESTLGQILMQRFGGTGVFTMILATNAITVVSLQIPITSYCLKRKNPLWLMKIGSFFIAGGLIGMGFSGLSYISYIISQIIFTLGEIFVFSIGGIFIDDIAPENLRGAYFGSLGFQSLGKAIGPVLGGALLQVLSGQIVLLIFAVIALGSIPLYDSSMKSNQ